jgi:hypothetical protein
MSRGGRHFTTTFKPTLPNICAMISIQSTSGDFSPLFGARHAPADDDFGEQLVIPLGHLRGEIPDQQVPRERVLGPDPVELGKQPFLSLAIRHRRFS